MQKAHKSTINTFLSFHWRTDRWFLPNSGQITNIPNSQLCSSTWCIDSNPFIHAKCICQHTSNKYISAHITYMLYVYCILYYIHINHILWLFQVVAATATASAATAAADNRDVIGVLVCGFIWNLIYKRQKCCFDCRRRRKSMFWQHSNRSNLDFYNIIHISGVLQTGRVGWKTRSGRHSQITYSLARRPCSNCRWQRDGIHRIRNYMRYVDDVRGQMCFNFSQMASLGKMFLAAIVASVTACQPEPLFIFTIKQNEIDCIYLWNYLLLLVLSFRLWLGHKEGSWVRERKRERERECGGESSEDVYSTCSLVLKSFRAPMICTHASHARTTHNRQRRVLYGILRMLYCWEHKIYEWNKGTYIKNKIYLLIMNKWHLVAVLPSNRTR